MPPKPDAVWYRLCVDVDHVGQPIGASHEVRSATGEEVITYSVHPIPGPFETPAECLQKMIDSLPLQGVLFT